MQSKYCIDLKIPVTHPLKDPSILNQTGYKPEIWFADPDNVSEEYLSWLDQNDLIMTYPPLIFYTPARRECGFHIDGDSVTDRAVMNWIVGGQGSEMHWYELAPDAVITKGEITQAGTPYTRYNEDQVIHLHSQPVLWPSLVQTGIPHKITNYCDEPRWCLSCDISLKSDPDKGLTMKQAEEIFKKWII
jgi:hypothetical protein